MCHLVLLLPVVGLGVFWMFPPGLALPLYGGLFALSVLLYVAVFKALGRRVVTGREALEGQRGEVVRLVRGGVARMQVKVGCEFWSARAADPDTDWSPLPGDPVCVLGVTGNVLNVTHGRSSPDSPRPRSCT